MSKSADAGAGAEGEPRGQEFDDWTPEWMDPQVDESEQYEDEDEDEGAGWAGAPTTAVFVVGALCGALILALVWFTTTTLAEDGTTSEAGGSGSEVGTLAQVGQEQSQEGQQPSARGTRLERCVLASDRLEASLGAAKPAMAQWEVHVGAMNQLVVGAISLQQATAFWNQTRLAAKRKIGRFQDSLRPVRRAGLDCPVPSRLGHASEQLRACAQSVDARAGAVDRAQTAIRTWAGHVQAMDMMKMGHLSPADATREWLASWRRGVREIEAYKGAARAAQRAGAC